MPSPSKLSHSPWKQPPLLSSTPSTVEDKNDDIQIIEEEEEEVLVDDFDGQCCRTFPYNHSKIQRWREERRRRDEERRAKEPRKEEAKQVKVPTSSTETSATSGKPGEPVTTTAGENQWRHTFLTVNNVMYLI